MPKREDNNDLLGNLFTSNASKKSNKKLGKKITITPRAIIFDALRAVYNVDPSPKKLEAFEDAVLKSLALLSTAGQHDNVMGSDFNEFFSILVNTINLTALMREALEEHGIEFDIKKYLENGFDEDDENGEEKEDE